MPPYYDWAYAQVTEDASDQEDCQTRTSEDYVKWTSGAGEVTLWFVTTDEDGWETWCLG